MRVTVVYESMFGCTEEIARAVTDGLAEAGAQVTCWDVREAPTPDPDLDLLVVAGPTHAFSMSRPASRESANEQGAHWEGPGIREWIDSAGSVGRFATIDTKVRRPRMPGSAGGAAERALKQHGGRAAVHHESFWVEGTPGPLLPGEADRARAWGRSLAGSAT